MNYVHLIGNLGADPEPLANKENPTAKLSIATSDSYNRTDEKGETKRVTDTTWHTVFFFGDTAEAILKYFKRGMKIAVTGRLKTNKKTDEKGVVRTNYFISGKEWEFVERSPKSNESGDTNSQSTPAASSKAPAYQQASESKTTSPAPVSKKEPLAATVPSHTAEDLVFDDADGTSDDLPF